MNQTKTTKLVPKPEESLEQIKYQLNDLRVHNTMLMNSLKTNNEDLIKLTKESIKTLDWLIKLQKEVQFYRDYCSSVISLEQAQQDYHTHLSELDETFKQQVNLREDTELAELYKDLTSEDYKEVKKAKSMKYRQHCRMLKNYKKLESEAVAKLHKKD